jgi:hypothetical protein
MKSTRNMALSIFFLVLTVPMISRAAEVNENVERLKGLGQACLEYMQDHDGQMPPTLFALYNEAYVKDLSMFSSPSRPISIIERNEIDEKSDYVLCPEKGPIVPEKPQLIVMKMPVDKFRPIIRDRSGKNNPKSEKMLVFFEDSTIYPLRPVMFVEDKTKDDVIKHESQKDAEKTPAMAVDVVRDLSIGLPLFIDMESSSVDAGQLISKKALELQPGKYRIRFNLVGDPLGTPRRVHFRVGDIYNGEVTLGIDDIVSDYKRDIVVTTPSIVRLVFQHQGGDFQNLMLDSVRLTKLAGQNR